MNRINFIQNTVRQLRVQLVLLGNIVTNGKLKDLFFESKNC